MNFILFSFLLICNTQLSLSKLTKSYYRSAFLDKANSVKISWTYDVRKDIVFIGLEVKATGWVGFGFAHRIFQMKDYDVIVGKVIGAKGILTDRHTVGFREPPADLQQDYNMTYFEEVNGITTIEFYRKRITGDSNDIDIVLGPILVVYAYHSSSDYPLPYRTRHDHQGHKTVVILPYDTLLPGNLSSSRLQSSTSSPSSPMTTPATKTLSSLPVSVISSSLSFTSSSLSWSQMQSATNLLWQSTSILLEPSSSLLASWKSISSKLSPSRFRSPSVDASKTSSISNTTSVILDASKTSDISSTTSVIHNAVLDYNALIKVHLQAKVTSVKYADIQDRKGLEFLRFKTQFEENIAKRSKVWKVLITNISPGSVLIDYDVLINSTSQKDAQVIINEIQQEVTSGKIGNFSVDPHHPLGAVITMKAASTLTTSPPKFKNSNEDKYLIVIIVLACAVGILLIVSIIVTSLLMCHRRHVHHADSVKLSTLSYTNPEYNY